MYIFRNALRSIIRSPGRTFLICIIVVVISTSACIALSIQQSAGVVRQATEDNLEIRAHINVDRQYVMETLQKDSDNSEESMQESVKNIQGLTLDDMLVYAEAASVEDFYYYSNISLNGDNGLTALNKNDYTELQDVLDSSGITSSSGGGQGQMGGPGGGGGEQMPSMQDIMATLTFRGDFILYGYISDKAMESFQDGDCYITSGAMFDPASDEYNCIITEELATYNSLKVGDTITLTNPGLSSERFLLTIVGLYKNSDDSTTTTVQAYDDPANYILTSYSVVQDIMERSKTFHNPAATASTVLLTDGTTGEQLLKPDGSVVVKGGVAAATEESESGEESTEESADGAETEEGSSEETTEESADEAAGESAEGSTEESADDSTADSGEETSDGTAEDSESSEDADTSEDSEEDSEESDDSIVEISDTVVGTYVFASLEDYDAFEVEARNMGLEDKYTVTSNDVASFEASLVPLDNLSSYANTFLYIILGVGSAILIGVNFYNIRERKYEIGALTAMGMRKWKVALQFVLELTMVTFLGIAIGLGIGAAVSVPVTNELLSSQISYEQTHYDSTVNNFGRDVSTATTKPRGGDVEGEVEYVSVVTFSVDYVVIYRMALMGLALTLISSLSAITSILRYNPLTILSERN